MGRWVDQEVARRLLADTFVEAEADYAARKPVKVPASIVRATERLFASKTQAYREALIGCILAKIIDPEIDITLPYAKQGDDAFNGRDLDEQVVNPFLVDRHVPSSKGPYLNVFRRSVRFDEATAEGVRDRDGYRAMLEYIEGLIDGNEDNARRYLRYLLYAFAELRDKADIPLAQIPRLSVEQYDTLIDDLLRVPSGGLMPVLLAVAMFQTIRQCFRLDWEIAWQGINVADRAAGVGGDITVTRGGAIVLAVEVTERAVDRNRVVATFRTKIAPHRINDYLFFYSDALPTADARAAARNYFAQGLEINFVPVKQWIITTLTTIGPQCRAAFTVAFLALLGGRDVSAQIKQGWNDCVGRVINPG